MATGGFCWQLIMADLHVSNARVSVTQCVNIHRLRICNESNCKFCNRTCLWLSIGSSTTGFWGYRSSSPRRPVARQTAGQQTAQRRRHLPRNWNTTSEKRRRRGRSGHWRRWSEQTRPGRTSGAAQNKTQVQFIVFFCVQNRRLWIRIQVPESYSQSARRCPSGSSRVFF